MKEKRSIWLLSPSCLIGAPAYSTKLPWNWLCCIFGSHSPLLGCSHTSKETHMRNMLVLQAGMPQCQASLPFPARPLGKRHPHPVPVATHQHNLHMALTSSVHTPKLSPTPTCCTSNTPGPRCRSRSPIPAASDHILPEPVPRFPASETKPLKGLG